MPIVKGFKAWRYDRAKVSDHARVLAPPYDVISKKDQAALYQKSPYNVIRLELGKEKAGDSAKHNRYTRARSFMKDWIARGVLVQDETPSIYVYAQDYKEGAKKSSRVGFFAAMKLDERAVLKHENTLAAPKKDRLALLKEVRTNLSPIFGLFEDEKGGVQKILKKTLSSRPLLDVTLAGVRHRLYREARTPLVRAVETQMRSKPMYIADGHHRFEVACQFKNWMRGRRKAGGEAAWDYVMAYFSDASHNPFTIYPTHRLIKVADPARALSTLKTRGRLEKVKNLGAILARLSKDRRQAGVKGYDFGVYSRKSGFFIFSLDKRHFSAIKNNPVDRLDVAVLHSQLIAPCFGITRIEKSERIDFTRDAKEACRQVQSGRFDLALFLRPTSLDEMLLASRKGLKMPQKSTYFYPKLLSGLVFHRFDD